MIKIAQFTYSVIDGYQFVYISVYDTSTGQLTNGDNMSVTYNQIVNGYTTTHTVTIPGQQVLIFKGPPDIGNSWSFISQTDDTNIGPPVTRCDLAINYINVDKPESAPGAFDGQITVSASSSYLPILYSKDNINFQPGNVFAGLPGGLLEIYIKDANPLGCIVQQAVTIPVTQSLLISDPSVSLTGGNISRWSAAFNPIIFTYQRKDFDVTGVTLDSVTGNAKIAVNGSTSAISAAVANNKAVINNAKIQGITLVNTLSIYVYINAGPYIGVYNVTDTDGNSFIINTPYNGTASGYVNINFLKPYYKIFTYISYHDPLTGTNTTIRSVNRPNAEGVTQADISSLLQSLLRIQDTSTYTLTNYQDTNLSASYTIQYQEQYDDINAPGNVITSTPISIAEPYYITYTARQLQSKNGGNMAEYVPFPTGQQAKWITDFAEPAYSLNYPFDLSFIYGETLAGLQLYYQITMLDINRQPLPGNTITSSLLNEDGSWLLNQDTSKMIIAAQSLSNTPVPQHIGLNRLLINTAFPDNAWYFTISLYYNDVNNNPVQVTKLQTVRIDHTPDINSVYLRWVGLTGSWNYYRFIYNQEISLDVQNATIIKNFITDWENQQGVEEVISKDAGQKMKVSAEDLSVADIKGLQSIKYSPKVQMLVSANPVKWQTVVINTATYSEYETLNGQAPFSVTFNMPSINIQTQ
jgi:hypothetical protein